MIVLGNIFHNRNILPSIFLLILYDYLNVQMVINICIENPMEKISKYLHVFWHATCLHINQVILNFIYQILKS